MRGQDVADLYYSMDRIYELEEEFDDFEEEEEENEADLQFDDEERDEVDR